MIFVADRQKAERKKNKRHKITIKEKNITEGSDLKSGKKAVLCSSARLVASELNNLRSKGLFIYDIKKEGNDVIGIDVFHTKVN